MATNEPSVALHIALIQALDNAVSCNVWDAVPPGAEYPYVTLDSIESLNQDFLSSRLDQRLYYLNIWSQVQGQAEVMQIISEIDTLHESKLALSEGKVISLRIERKRTMRDIDNLTFQGQVTIRIFLQHED